MVSVERVKRAIRLWMHRQWPRFVLWLAPAQQSRPATKVWEARPFHSETDHTAWVVFTRDDSALRSDYHVGVLHEITAAGLWLLVNLNTCDALVHPVNASSDVTADSWLVRREAVKYVVGVPAGFQTDAKPDASVGAVSCVTLAKRCIGMHARRVETPCELLDKLWGRRINGGGDDGICG